MPTGLPNCTYTMVKAQNPRRAAVVSSANDHAGNWTATPESQHVLATGAPALTYGTTAPDSTLQNQTCALQVWRRSEGWEQLYGCGGSAAAAAVAASSGVPVWFERLSLTCPPTEEDIKKAKQKRKPMPQPAINQVRHLGSSVACMPHVGFVLLLHPVPAVPHHQHVRLL